VKIRALQSWSRISEGMSAGYRFPTVALLSVRLLTESLRPQSVFLTNQIDAAADDEDCWVDIWARFVSM